MASARVDPAVYRRRRIAVGGAAFGVAVLLLVLARSCGGAGTPVDAGSGTTLPVTTTIDPSKIVPATGPATTAASWQTEYLACVRQEESGGNYQAVSPAGDAFGAYQFDQETWNNTVVRAGIPGAYQVQPNEATPATQDEVALALLNWKGSSAWTDGC